jgi:sporulation protein YlmC with PRC-barrel domain
MFLFRDVIDRQLVDRHGHKAGKVDDMVLEIPPGECPAVRAIRTGRGASPPIFPSWLTRFLAWFEDEILGTRRGQPVDIGWEHVTRIDVVVRIDLDREQAGLMDTEHRIWQRWVRHVPGSER